MTTSPPIPPTEPEWLQGLQWIIAAVLLAFATVGPKLLGPFIERWKSNLPPPTPIATTIGDQKHRAIVGAAFAERKAIVELAIAVNRLATVMESREKREVMETQAEELERRIEEAVKARLGKT